MTDTSSKHDRMVVCMKWGTAFSPDTVNILFNATMAHVDHPTRFICITDDPTGLLPGIEIRDFTGLDLPERAWKAGAWPKIFVFKDGVLDGTGRVLFIDLDSFILRSLEPFFIADSPFKAIGLATWRRTRPRTKPWIYKKLKPLVFDASRKIGLKKAAETDHLAFDAEKQREMESQGVRVNSLGTGVFAFDANSLTHVWDNLVRDFDHAVTTYSNEQHFVENQIDTWEPWPAADVVSYKSNCRQPIGRDWIAEPDPAPPETRILAFHGDPRPTALARNRFSSKRELPHVWFGPVSWARDYFERYLP